MNHVVQRGDRAISVRDDRKIDRGLLRVVDVPNPLFVLIDRVHADGDGLDAAPGKLSRERRGFAQLGRADRREIGRMRKQNDPRIACPLMKMDSAFGRVLREVGGCVAQTKCGHSGSPLLLE